MTDDQREIDGMGQIWAVLDQFEPNTQLRILRASFRRAADALRKKDKEFDTYQRLKAKFEPDEDAEQAALQPKPEGE